MSELDALKARNIFEADVADVHVKGRYVDMEQMLMSGSFDVRVLAELEELLKLATPDGTAETPAVDADPAQIAEGLRYRRAVVCACLVEVNGEPVQLTEDDYHDLPSDFRDEFFNLAARIVEVPKAEG